MVVQITLINCGDGMVSIGYICVIAGVDMVGADMVGAARAWV